MMLNVAAPAEITPFQRHLVPESSDWVRFCLQNAGKFSTGDNFFTSRVYSVACAVAAVVFAAFNMISYTLRAPLRVLLNIVEFSPLKALIDLVSDVRDAVLSFLIVSLGVTFVVAGLIFPAPIFTNFAPECIETLQSQIGDLKQSLKERDEELKSSGAEVDAIGKACLELESKHEEVVKGLREEIRALKARIRELEASPTMGARLAGLIRGAGARGGSLRGPLPAVQ